MFYSNDFQQNHLKYEEINFAPNESRLSFRKQMYSPVSRTQLSQSQRDRIAVVV